MKYELANRVKPGFMSHFWGVFRKGPSVALAAKSGTPSMAVLRPAVPVSVPTPVSGEAASADVTAATVSGDSTALDTQPDARQNPPGATASGQPGSESLPTNRQAAPKKNQNSKKQQKQ
jgi:hypothetical protein